MLSSLSQWLTRGSLELSPDDAFSVISNSRRRQVILLVDEHTDPVSVGTLAVKIAARENQVTPEAVDCGQRKTVYIALIQAHLDTLADVEAIHYDEREKVVAATEHTSVLADYIQRLTVACDTTGVAGFR